MQPSNATRGDNLRIALAVLAVLIVVCLLYAPALSFPFLQWDDQLHLTANPFIQPDSPDRYLHFWKQPYGKMYVPVSYNTWEAMYVSAIDTNGAATPRIFHLANILAHAANGAMVLLLLRRLHFSLLAAFAGAMLFCVHPLQVEAVAWISEWRGLLASLLSLAAIHIHLSRWNDGAPRSRMLALDLLAMLLLLLALLSKPIAAVTPAIMLILDTLVLQRRLRACLSVLALPILLALAALVAQSRLQDVVVSEAIVWWKRPLVAGDALSFYLGKLFWPLDLCADYARTPRLVEQSAAFWFAWIIPGSLGACLLRFGRPKLLAGGLLFFVPLLPVLGFVWFEFQLISTTADRYCYLAMIGVALVAATVVDRHPTLLCRITAAACLVSLAILSWRQLQTWQGDASLWHHAFQVNPNSSVAMCNIASQLMDAGKTQEAKGLFERAAALAPTRASPLLGLASIARDRGDVVEAEAKYRRAMSAAPHDATAFVDLVSLLGQSGRLGEAEIVARQAIQVDRQSANAWNNLGAVLYQLDRLDEAKTALMKAIELHPRHANAHNALARVLAARNDPAADTTMELAARFDDADPTPCQWLGKRALERQDFATAERWFREAVRRNPRDLDSLNDLGQSLGLQNQGAEAIAAFEAALKLAPGHPVIQANLEAARRLKEKQR